MKRLLSLALVVCASMLAQNAALLPAPKAQFLDAAGVPLAGGFLYTCVVGSACTPAIAGDPALNPLATFTDSTAGVSNTNPIVLDSAGRANVWLGASTYKLVLEDATGGVVWTQDGVSSTSMKSVTAFTATSGNAANFTVTAAGTGAVSRTVAAKLGDIVSVKDFGAVGDCSSDDTTKIQAALNSGANTVLFPASSSCYLISSALTVSSNTNVVGLGYPVVKTNVSLGGVFSIASASNVSLRGIHTLQTAAYPGHYYDGVAISIWATGGNSSHVSIEDNIIDGAPNGLVVHPNTGGTTYVVSDLLIRRNQFVNPAVSTGLGTASNPIDINIGGRADDVRVEQNYMPGANDYGVMVLPNGNVNNIIQRVHILRNQIANKNMGGVVAYRSTIGGSVNVYDVEVSGNDVSAISSRNTGLGFEYGHGIYIQSVIGFDVGDNTVKNTLNLNNGSSLPPGGIAVNDATLAGDYSQGRIHDNTVDTTNSATVTSAGIYYVRGPGGSANVTISDNHVRNSTGSGILDLLGDHAVISGNIVSGTTKAGIYSWQAKYVTIAANTVTGGTPGIRVNTGTNNTITGNTAWGNNGQGIAVEVGNTVVTGNSVINNSQGSTGVYSGIDVNSGGALANVVIVGNQAIDTQGTPTQAYGIKVSALATNVTLANNTTAGNATAALQMSGAGVPTLLYSRLTVNGITDDGSTPLQILGGIKMSGGTPGITTPDNVLFDITATNAGAQIRLNAGGAASSSTGLLIGPTYVRVPAQKATTGQRYACIDTSGNIVSSAAACSGT